MLKRKQFCLCCTDRIWKTQLFRLFGQLTVFSSKRLMRLLSLFVIPKLLSRRIMSNSIATVSDNVSTIVNNAHVIASKVKEASRLHRGNETGVTLVAVSKTKPVEDIRQLYDNGYRIFGENYFEELVEKAVQLPNDIKWHFIGHLQSSKAAKLVKKVTNLDVVETVDSIKLANKLNNACEVRSDPLKVYIQVDTSGEETKFGVTEDEMVELAEVIVKDCPRLQLKGVMTIGAPNDFSCFDKLVVARERLAGVLGVDANTLELSMGMSGDFEEAIVKGATSVRVGSSIFGPRLYPNKS